MVIGYISEGDASSPDYRSGRPHSILRAFGKSGLGVKCCFPLQARLRIAERLGLVIARRMGRHYQRTRSPQQLRSLARAAHAVLARTPHDFVFAPSTLPIAYLNSLRPVVFSSDATFRSMVDYYPAFSGLNRSVKQAYESAERAALRRADLLVYSSDWAANSASNDYSVPDDRIAVIPSGANIGASNRASDVTRWSVERDNECLQLLFVGAAWERKGGPLCVETARILNARGLATTLHIVGCRPNLPEEDAAFTVVHGRLRSSVPAEKKALMSAYQRAHLLFIPSRAESFGMAFCEAGAFGIPSVSNATGGIRSVIKPGINGILLSPGSDAAAYADAITSVWLDRDRYMDLGKSSYQEFRRRLNWDAWMNSFLGRLDTVMANARPTANNDSSRIKLRPEESVVR